MEQKIYQIDTFTNQVFSGNPAAVCPLYQWLSDDILRKIAEENNLAETAFYVKQGNDYQIRWFTPAVEVDLCGHATLAAAFVLFHYEGHQENGIRFYAHRSGFLTVTKKGELMTLNFPTDRLEAIELTETLSACFDRQPKAAFKGKTDYMLVFDTEEEIRTINPYLDKIAELDARGIMITAPGADVDFISRFFAPQSGINEDSVTGSAHTALTPYWAQRLGKSNLTAIQASKRGGYLKCRYLTDRVEISGEARLYLRGEIYIR